MAPPRSKPAPDDSRSEASSTKEKAAANSSNVNVNANGKGKRGAAGAAGGSNLKDVVMAGTSGTLTSSAANSDSAPGLQWNTFDSEVLHGYRYDHRLNIPAAFNKTYNQLVLARSPIGRMSPTMAQAKTKRRQTKDQLASNVRKHFNSMGISENEVVVDFMYKVRWQDKNFRMRFNPQQQQQQRPR